MSSSSTLPLLLTSLQRKIPADFPLFFSRTNAHTHPQRQTLSLFHSEKWLPKTHRTNLPELRLRPAEPRSAQETRSNRKWQQIAGKEKTFPTGRVFTAVRDLFFLFHARTHALQRRGSHGRFPSSPTVGFRFATHPRIKWGDSGIVCCTFWLATTGCCCCWLPRREKTFSE